MDKDKRKSIHNYQGSTLFIFKCFLTCYLKWSKAEAQQILTENFRAGKHDWKEAMRPSLVLMQPRVRPQYSVVQGSPAAAPMPRLFKWCALFRVCLRPTVYTPTLRGFPSLLQISNGHQITFCIFSHFNSISRCSVPSHATLFFT